jgi:hypothetical protein
MLLKIQVSWEVTLCVWEMLYVHGQAVQEGQETIL